MNFKIRSRIDTILKPLTDSICMSTFNIQSHTARHMKLFLEINNNEINVSPGINVDHKKNSK